MRFTIKIAVMRAMRPLATPLLHDAVLTVRSESELRSLDKRKQKATRLFYTASAAFVVLIFLHACLHCL